MVVRTRVNSDQDHATTVHAVDEQPVRFDMAFPHAAELSHQRVVPSRGAETLLLLKITEHIMQFREILPLLLETLEGSL